MRGRGWRLGLDRMQAFLSVAGLGGSLGPTGPSYLHVAGTNGKGSVTAYLQSLLASQGWRTGATFSPYVYDLRERVQIGRELIAKEEFAACVEALLPAAEAVEAAHGPVTEFEFKTAIGFLAWKRAKCEWVALEVGLGGRLDATNVVKPAACAVVSIGRDHMAILGDTLEKIAFEKGGIIKPGVPVVIGEMAPGPRDVLLEIAAARGASAWLVGRDVLYAESASGVCVRIPGAEWQGLRLGVPGPMQTHNLAVAIASLAAGGAIRNADQVADGAAKARAPGRFERRRAIGADWILDGAHNVDAARVLASGLRAGSCPRVMLTGMLSGHESRPFYRELSGLFDSVHVVPIDSDRSRRPDELAAEIADLFPSVVAHSTLQTGLEACAREGGAVVTGSFYLVGETGRSLA